MFEIVCSSSELVLLFYNTVSLQKVRKCCERVFVNEALVQVKYSVYWVIIIISAQELHSFLTSVHTDLHLFFGLLWNFPKGTSLVIGCHGDRVVVMDMWP